MSVAEAIDFRPDTPEFLRDPFPLYRRLREEDPVHWSPRLKAWVLTRYDDCKAVLLDKEISSDRLRPYFATLPGAEAARIGEIIRSVESAGTAARPPYVSDLSALKILPPIIPTTMMNVAVNYAEHDVEMARIREGSPGQAKPTAGGALPGTKSAPGIWERSENDPRWNPYMFLKAPAAIIAHGEAIRLPPGRTQVEWECELGLVIGRTASHVPTASATDYIFGYTLQNDVSDRGGRGDTRYGSDWLVIKNHDTFAPLGPFITPKEFVPNVQKLPIRFSLNGKVLQEGTTAQMIHTVVEQMNYATNILTLRTGDIIATGTLPGAGSARTPPVFLKPGDRSECTYEGVGTLINPVVGPQGAGAQ